MPSQLDLMITAAIDKTVGPGRMFELGTIDRRGVTMPIILGLPAALPQFFAHFCAQHADAVFLVDGDERLTFAETYAAARRFAAALVDGFGVRTGDRVGIAMRNAPAWAVSYMGIAMAGGVATLLNGWWQGEELAAGIRDAGCGIVLVDGPRARRLEGTVHGAECIELDLSLAIDAAIAPVCARGGHEGTRLPTVGSDDIATILFTSGSTGQSKGAVSRHGPLIQGIFNYVVQTASVVHLLTAIGNPPEGQPSTLLNVPLFHITGEVPVFLQSFVIGRKLVMMAKWDAEAAMRLIEAERVTYFVGVPLMSYEMLIHPNRHNYDLSSCKSFAAGGAPRPRDHVRRLAEGMGGGMPLLGYGLTETNAVGCGNLNDNYIAKPDSTGPASAPLVDLAIVDDNGSVLPQGETGEVTIRSAANFDGYWNNDAATAAAFTADARFRTGDIGYLDADGYLFIVDRKKDIIIRGGENISCPEVEAAIYAFQPVAECSVFALPDDRFGEIVGAVVRFDAGFEESEAALMDFLAASLAAYKVPAVVWTVRDPLPVLGTGKLDRVGIRRHYQQRHAAADQGALQ